MVQVGGTILVSPYTSIREIVQEHVGSVISWLTAGYSARKPEASTRASCLITSITDTCAFVCRASDWKNVEMMKQINCPVLLIHGTTDEIIPASHSKALHGACTSPKRLILLEKVGHQEMELLYALVQASPGMFALYDKPKQVPHD